MKNKIPVKISSRKAEKHQFKDSNNKNVKTVKRSNKFIQALQLPVIANLNPRSVYNKVDEFHTFVQEEEVDILFMSESWEREYLKLDQIIHLENHTVISNVYQRIGKGGRPALVVNKDKYHVQDITNTLIDVKWGVEAVWCLLTPKNITQDSKIQKIACAAIYSKPGSKHKSDLLDHVSEAFNMLSAKFGKGLHFCIAGDTNELKLDSILSLSSNLVQVVTKPTRIDPKTGAEALLDPVIMTLSQYYQEPLCLDPLDPDPDKDGKKSDHRIVLMKPINVINNKTARITRRIKVRPIPESGIIKMRDWLMNENWESVFKAETAHKKAAFFQEMLIQKFELIFPEKTRKINSDDAPWMTEKLKKLDRRRKRIYHKERRSEKWRKLDKNFKQEVKSSKENFYSNMIADLRNKKPSQWYSSLKRISGYDQKSENVVIEEINQHTDQQQAEKIADYFSSIPNEYEALKNDDIEVPPFTKDQILQFRPSQVWLQLSKVKTNKSTVSGDLPAKLIKEFAAYLAEPFTDIINTSLKRGEYPQIYKYEISTPVPKVFPPQKVDQMRNISGLFTFDKVMEKMISEVMISDMKPKTDPSQYGNEKGTSIQHYLIKMIHRVLTVLDNNSRRETFAVVANLIDWNSAFPRQCPKLGVQSFIKNGVRPSLIPLLINYFQDRQMSVKWHGCQSVPRSINGGGPQGATLGILEYLSQSNNSADCVSEEDRFKFVDDLTVLEIVNLLTIGITCFNIKQQVPSDIITSNQFIPSSNLRSQDYLDRINLWTKNQKMIINQKKSKIMLFNFTKNFQFSTRLTIDGAILETVQDTKLLGTIVSNDLKWNKNTSNIVKKANKRMELLRKISSFGASWEELKNIYILYIRSLLEQSCTVWHSGLTDENSQDLERVQKSALRIILQESYHSYKNALNALELESLVERRESLCLQFAKKCLTNEKMKHLFPQNHKTHLMITRFEEMYEVNNANTERLKNSPIIYMQRLLNGA